MAIVAFSRCSPSCVTDAAPATRDPLLLLSVEHAVAAVLLQCETGEEAFYSSLEAVAGTLGWDHAALWVPRRDGRLHCAADWQAPGSDSEAFAVRSRGLTLAPGEGLPGRVWADGAPSWVVDFAADPTFPRAPEAAAAGLHSAVAFALEGPAGLSAVTEVLTRARHPPDPDLLKSLQSIGRRVGQFVEHKRAERAVVDSEARKRAILDAALDCIITIDQDGIVVEANAALERVFGWTPDEAIGREMAQLIVPPELREAHRQGLRRLVDGAAPRVLGRRVELTGARRGGATFPVELAITRIDVPGRPMFTGHIRDITDRHEAEAELKASRVRVLQAADDARRRIERDLHDGAQQRLVALALTLRLAENRLADDPDASVELLREAREDLAEATAELRELARGIHPAVLTESGLAAALAGLVRRSPVAVVTHIDVQDRPPAPIEAAAYFVAAEALANAARHAGADTIELSVSVEADTLVLVVADDGDGGAAIDAGSGLRGLVDRLAALGGTLTIASPPGVGTTLRAHIPLA